jgi:SM-20-related protein
MAGNSLDPNRSADTATAATEAAVEQLETIGYAVCVGLLSPLLVAGLLAEQRRREDSGELVVAKIGRGDCLTHATGQRHASSSWFSAPADQSAAEQQFLAFAEDVRRLINRRLMLGLFEFEAQFLHYPPGGFYGRHIDALRGERNRVVSMVAYLNEQWTITDGGTLAVWPPTDLAGAGEPAVEVMPMAGTVVLMLSEDIPHEARVAQRERRAIAGWYRVNGSSTQRVDLAR